MEVAHEYHTILHNRLVICEFLTGEQRGSEANPERYQEIAVSSLGPPDQLPKYL